MRSRLLAAVLALGVPAALVPALAPALAWADGEKADKADKAQAAKPERYDPDNITAISELMETIVKGSDKFKAKDTTAAIDLFKKAVQLGPKNPLGYYYLTEAEIAAGNLGEAEAAITEAGHLTDARNPLLRGLVLFSIADVFERQKKWEQAKTAWQAYSEYAAKFGGDGGMFPQTSAERLKTIQKVLEMEKAYVAVRERIAAEKTRDAGKK
jgi:tetratricopeptide (TPR) repeat protein